MEIRQTSVAGAFTAWTGAVLSSLCCLLPLAVVLLGLGSGAFMAVTMQYRWLLIPAGMAGVGTGFFLYFRERRRCDRLGCRMAGSRLTLTLLAGAAAVLATEITLAGFPELTADLLTRAAGGATMGGMR